MPDVASTGPTWNRHIVRAGPHKWEGPEIPAPSSSAGAGAAADVDNPYRKFVDDNRKAIEPWLAALLQAEHVSLLAGSGFTTAIALLAGAPLIDMNPGDLAAERVAAILKNANNSATRIGRGRANIEDMIRVVRELIAGLTVIADVGGDKFQKDAYKLLKSWEKALGGRLAKFMKEILTTESGIHGAINNDDAKARDVQKYLGSFLLSFASRTATRERLHVFTTNYDRLIEYGCDMLGLRILDRFVGRLNPIFRASRLGVDLHYNPPGIRGEPRYLEGVVRLSKLHGSLDWKQEDRGPTGSRIVRSSVPFGAPADHPDLPQSPLEELIIYPNPAKDIETLEYPYAELFRDFAGAVCQPNAVIITYGYGFGDDHVNRVIRDMLTIPSTHLAIISFDDASGRIPRFCAGVARDEQITLLIGSHFGSLKILVDEYLPKPAIDRNTWRMVELREKRGERPSGSSGAPAPTQQGSSV